MNRRSFSKISLGVLGGISSNISTGNEPNQNEHAAENLPELNLRNTFSEPVRIRSVEGIRVGEDLFVRVQSTEGAVGLAAGNRLLDLLSLLKRRVIPFFVNKDARELESLIKGVYTHQSNYKYAGMPFWNAVAHVELAVLDMLGKIGRRPAGALLGRVRRTEIPVYISRFNRNSTPEQEVNAARRALARTGARAVKLKVGLRMRNSPAQSRRDRAMIELARRTLGDGVAIYVDANGSYTPREAIEFGRFLQQHQVGFIEEPCPWEEHEQTKQVADALEMTLAGGEQDSSLPRWRWMIRNRAVNLIQPDVYYNGGLLRTLRLANMARAAGLSITPHSPKTGAAATPMLHLASVVPNIGPHQEYRESNEVRRGVVQIPTGHGLGFAVDPGRLRRAEVL